MPRGWRHEPRDAQPGRTRAGSSRRGSAASRRTCSRRRSRSRRGRASRALRRARRRPRGHARGAPRRAQPSIGTLPLPDAQEAARGRGARVRGGRHRDRVLGRAAGDARSAPASSSAALILALPVTLALQWGLRSRYLSRPKGLAQLGRRPWMLLLGAVALVAVPSALLGLSGAVAGLLTLTWTGGTILIRRALVARLCRRWSSLATRRHGRRAAGARRARRADRGGDGAGRRPSPRARASRWRGTRPGRWAGRSPRASSAPGWAWCWSRTAASTGASARCRRSR